MNSLQLNINLNFQQLVEVVKQLSPSQKLKLKKVVWEDAADISLEDQKLVLERIKKSKNNPTRMLDWEKASKTLNP